MNIRGPLIALALVLAAFVAPAHSQSINRVEPGPPNGPLNTLEDVYHALRGCWRWPPANETTPGMQFTVQVSFRSNGDIFDDHITYQSAEVSDKERALYQDAMLQALKRCSPLPVSASLGEAIAGRPMIIRIRDTQDQRIDPR